MFGLHKEVKNSLESQMIRIYCAIETRGGYHFILKNEDIDGKQKRFIFTELDRHKVLTKNSNGKEIMKDSIDILKDPMAPIPGTYQGGFPVKIVLIDGFPPQNL